MAEKQNKIEKIVRKLVKEKVALLKSCGFTDDEIRNRISVEDVRGYVTDTITEWEKLK